MEPKMKRNHERVLSLYKGGQSIEKIKDIVKIYSEEYINAIVNNDFKDVYKEKDIDVFKTMKQKGYSCEEISERTGYSLSYLKNYSYNNNIIRNNNHKHKIIDMNRVLYNHFCEFKTLRDISLALNYDYGFVYRTIRRFYACIGVLKLDKLYDIVQLIRNDNADISTICKKLNISRTVVHEYIMYYKLRLNKLLFDLPVQKALIINYRGNESFNTLLLNLEKDCIEQGIDANKVLEEFNQGYPIFNTDEEIVMKNPNNESEAYRFNIEFFINSENNQPSKILESKINKDMELVRECDREIVKEEWNEILDNMDSNEKTFDDIIEETDQKEEEYNDIISLMNESDNSIDATDLMMYGNDILKSLYNSYVISDEKNIDLKIDVHNKSIIIKPDDSVLDKITIKLK